jgi:hypothetical protein
MNGALGAAVILLAAMSTSAAAQQHFPTNEDLRHLRTISSPQLSPDLKHVVVTVQDSTTEGGRTHLWLLSTDGRPYRQLTFNQGESSAERNQSICPMAGKSCSCPVATESPSFIVFRLKMANRRTNPWPQRGSERSWLHVLLDLSRWTYRCSDCQ